MKLAPILVITLLIFSCAPRDHILTFKVKETAGIERDLEYVEIQLQAETKPEKEDSFSISSEAGVFEGQILNIEKGMNSFP